MAFPVNRSLSHFPRARGAPTQRVRSARSTRSSRLGGATAAGRCRQFLFSRIRFGAKMELGRSGRTIDMSPPRRRWCGRRGRAQRASATGSSTTDRQIRRTSSLSPACVRSGISGWRVGALYPMAGGRRSAERRGEFSNNRKQGDWLKPTAPAQLCLRRVHFQRTSTRQQLDYAMTL
jgi:hypothetical protein